MSPPVASLSESPYTHLYSSPADRILRSPTMHKSISAPVANTHENVSSNHSSKTNKMKQRLNTIATSTEYGML